MITSASNQQIKNLTALMKKSKETRKKSRQRQLSRLKITGRTFVICVVQIQYNRGLSKYQLKFMEGGTSLHV